MIIRIFEKDEIIYAESSDLGKNKRINDRERNRRINRRINNRINRRINRKLNT